MIVGFWNYLLDGCLGKRNLPDILRDPGGMIQHWCWIKEQSTSYFEVASYATGFHTFWFLPLLTTRRLGWPTKALDHRRESMAL
jgi:hypothetical protein